MNRYCFVIPFALLSAALAVVGCSNTNPPTAAQPKPDAVSAEEVKLSPSDSALADAQGWCAVNTDERLGAMGAPLKLTIKGKPVFVCCKGCKKDAEADPDKTLAKVEELKAKVKAERDTKK